MRSSGPPSGVSSARSSEYGPRPGSASASTRLRTPSSSARWSPSSITRKWGGTPASSGKRLSRAWQKAWIVWMRMPPGTSRQVANRVRARASSARSGALPMTLAQVPAQRGVVHQGPLAEPGRDPVDHLRRGGLGEGQAQDAGRRGAVQQQPQHAPGQHMGLARAGAGADPGRDIRFRGSGLGARGGPSGIAPRPGLRGAAHGSASASAHSRMRARCS